MQTLFTWKGHIDSVSFTLAHPSLPSLAAAGPDVLLVHVNEEDGGVAVEQVLGAIAVVHVEVHDHHLQEGTVDMLLPTRGGGGAVTPGCQQPRAQRGHIAPMNACQSADTIN